MPRQDRRQRRLRSGESRQKPESGSSGATDPTYWALGAAATIVGAYAVARFGFGVDPIELLLRKKPDRLGASGTYEQDPDPPGAPVSDADPAVGAAGFVAGAPSTHGTGASSTSLTRGSSGRRSSVPAFSDDELRTVLVDGRGRGASVVHVVAGLRSEDATIAAAAAKVAERHASHKALRMEMTRLGGLEALLDRLTLQFAEASSAPAEEPSSPDVLLLLLLRALTNYCSDAAAADLFLDYQRQARARHSMGPLDALQGPLSIAARAAAGGGRGGGAAASGGGGAGGTGALGPPGGEEVLQQSLQCLGNMALLRNPAIKLLQRGAFAQACLLVAGGAVDEAATRRALALACNVAVSATTPVEGRPSSVTADAAMTGLQGELGEGAGPLARWLAADSPSSSDPAGAASALRVLLTAASGVAGRRALLRNESQVRGAVVPWLSQARVLTEERSRAERTWRGGSPRGRGAATAPGVSLAVSVLDLREASEAGASAAGKAGEDAEASSGVASVDDLRASGFMLVGGDGAHLEGRSGSEDGRPRRTAGSSAPSTPERRAGDPTESGLTARGEASRAGAGGGDGEASTSELQVLPDEGLGEEARECVILAARLAREVSRADPVVLMRVLDAAARKRVQRGGLLPQLGRPVEHF